MLADPHDYTPEEYCAVLFESASASLHADVFDMIQATFDAFAVPNPSPLAKQLDTKQTDASTPKAFEKRVSFPLPASEGDKGVPFEDIPVFLESLGCATAHDVVRRSLYRPLTTKGRLNCCCCFFAVVVGCVALPYDWRDYHSFSCTKKYSSAWE